MSPFNIKLPLGDDEKRTLQAAIDHYLQVCRREIRKGTYPPFVAHRDRLRTYETPRKGIQKPHRNSTWSAGEWGEDEMTAIEAALASYVDACEREIADGATEPFVADRAVVKRIRTKIGEAIERRFDELRPNARNITPDK
jgi:hypothetical protein